MKFLVFTLLLISSNAFSLTRTILTVTNDIDETDLSCMYVDLDRNYEIRKLIFDECREGDRDKPAIYVYPQRVENGVVIYQTEGHDVISLFSDNFSSNNGGDFTIRYLYNGLTGSYKTIQFKLSRSRTDNSWEITHRNSKIRRIHFLGRRLKWIKKVIGIDDYQAN